MLGCLEVVECSLKERFSMKYLHQVSYLRLQDVIGVCLSYCYLSGTTPGIISAFAKCNWCVPIILLSIRYNVCTCRQCYCCLLGILCVSWLWDHRACISQEWIVSADAGCAGNRRILVQTAVWYEIITPGIISAWCGCSSYCCLSGTTCVPVSPVYHYITATAVYLIQRFITACVVVMWSHSLYLSRMNSQCVQHVCCKSTSTRWKSGLRWNTHGADKHNVCLVFSIACICELP